MINVNVVESSVITAVISTDPVGIYGPYQFHIGSAVLVRGATSTAAEGSIDLSRLVQSPKAWGSLRDKGVSHLKADGDITVMSNEFDLSLTTGTWVIPWGIEGQKIEFFGDQTWEDSLYWYEVTNPLVAFYWFFYGDNAVLTCGFYREEYKKTRKTTGIVTAYGPQQQWFLNRFTFSNNKIKRSVVSVTGSYIDSTILYGGVTRAISHDGLAPLATTVTTTTTQAVVSAAPPVEDPEVTLAKCLSILDTNRKFDELHFQRPESFDFGELSVELLDQLRVIDENVLFLIFDVADWKNIMSAENGKGFLETYNQFLAHVKSILSGSSSMSRMERVRALSSDYLYKKYAIDTLISDVRRIQEGLVKFVSTDWNRRIHSRREIYYDDGTGNVNYYQAVLTAIVGQYPDWVLGHVQGFIGDLKMWGVYPRLTDLWDILPYSFVADWFVDFGGFFDEAAEYQEVRDYFPVQYVIQSEKWSKIVAADVIVPYQAVGDVTISYYHRWITRDVPLPPVSLGWGPGLTTKWVQSGALVMQRSRPRRRSL